MNEYESMEVSVRTGSILQLKTAQTPCYMASMGIFSSGKWMSKMQNSPG